MESQHTILVGNGINRIDGDYGWAKLLQDIFGKNCVPDTLNTLQYEYQRLNEMSMCEDGGTEEDVNFARKKRIARWAKKIKSNGFHKKIALLPVENILTTNYDHAIENALKESSYLQNGRLSCHTEERYNMRRFNYMKKGNDVKRIWHIHGDMNCPKSILIGFNHYCGTVGKIDRFLKGGYFSEARKGRKEIKLEDRYEAREGKMKEISDKKFWLPFFLNTDVHIIGLGMDDAEMDLWWVLSRRIRLQKKESSLVKNTIYYYGCPNETRLRLLERFGVTVIYGTRTKEEILANDWKALYNRLFLELEKRIKV